MTEFVLLNLKKKIWDACFNIRSKSCKKISAEDSFVAWDESHSLTAKTLEASGTYKSLDEVFTDESVGSILYTIFVPPIIKFKDIYKFLIDSKLTNIYSRKKSNGRYSDYAVKMFGFPSDEKDGIITDEESDNKADDESDNKAEANWLPSDRCDKLCFWLWSMIFEWK